MDKTASKKKRRDALLLFVKKLFKCDKMVGHNVRPHIAIWCFGEWLITLVKFSKISPTRAGSYCQQTSYRKWPGLARSLKNAKVLIFHRKSAENASLRYWENIC
jgi:hypothetical protein